MQGASKNTNVVMLTAYRNRKWTKTEHALLMRALHILSKRGDAHYPEYFEDDAGNPIVAFTVGYHADASYSVSKVKGHYVVLRWDGMCIADCPSLLEALALTFYGGAAEPRVMFLEGIEIVEKVLAERGKRGSVQA